MARPATIGSSMAQQLRKSNQAAFEGKKETLNLRFTFHASCYLTFMSYAHTYSGSLFACL